MTSARFGRCETVHRRAVSGVLPALCALALSLSGPSARAEVEVRVSGAQVELSAKAAPLAEVLDRLTRQTGIKLVYEGSAPRQLVTLSLRGRSPADTVLALLEGQGVNFALVADPTGSRPQTLMIAGLAGTGSAGGNRGTSPGPGRTPFPPTPEPPFVDDQSIPDDLALPSTRGEAITPPEPIEAPAPAASPPPPSTPATQPMQPFVPQPLMVPPQQQPYLTFPPASQPAQPAPAQPQTPPGAQGP